MNQTTPLLKLLRTGLFLCSFALLLIGIFSKRGVLDLRRMFKENNGLNTKLAALELQKNDLENQIKRFENDKDEREKIIRQVLGYVKANETVIEFE